MAVTNRFLPRCRLVDGVERKCDFYKFLASLHRLEGPLFIAEQLHPRFVFERAANQLQSLPTELLECLRETRLPHTRVRPDWNEMAFHRAPKRGGIVRAMVGEVRARQALPDTLVVLSYEKADVRKTV